VLLVGAALVAVGLRGNVSLFRAVTWLGVLLVAAVLIACVLSARRRWVDMLATAELADQRGQLTDRLATLVDLRRRPRPSRLAPVLIAQTLALGERWHLQRIAPRRVPRSVFLALLSLIALTASPLVAPAPPPAAQPATPRAAQPAPPQVLSPTGRPDRALPVSASVSGNAGSTGEAAGAHDVQPAANELHVPSAESAADTQLAQLPDRLRSAILEALHADKMDQAQQLEKGATGQSPGSPSVSEGDDRAGAQPDGRAGHHSDQAGKPAPGQAGGTSARQRPGNANTGDQPQHAKSGSSDRDQSGSAPNAGTGSSPENLLGAAAPATESGHGGTTTFKLTITSFLRGVEDKDKPARQMDKQGGGAGVPTDRDETIPALNDRQLRDDALRKAEIPPEYEDIVRRVYSSRPLDVQDALLMDPGSFGAVASDPAPALRPLEEGSGAPQRRRAQPRRVQP
jgi:hypothetical protein